MQVRSELPDEDGLGPVGCTVALKVEAEGALLEDRASVPPVRFDPSTREAVWDIPYGHNFAGVDLFEGTQLVVDTGPLGWRGTVTLPRAGETVDTSADDQTLQETWALRESDYHRALLTPDRMDR